LPYHSTKRGEATTPTTLALALDEMNGDAVLRRLADSYAVLNPEFSLIKGQITTLDSG
jgi:hypothetical protein